MSPVPPTLATDQSFLQGPLDLFSENKIFWSDNVGMYFWQILNTIQAQ